MSLNISVEISGSETTEELDTMIDMVTKENDAKLLLDSNGNLLPMDTDENLKSSYATVLTRIMLSAHESYMKQAEEKSYEDIKASLKASTKKQKAVVLAAITSLKEELKQEKEEKENKKDVK